MNDVSSPEEWRTRLNRLVRDQKALIGTENQPTSARPGGVLTCYRDPVVTRDHVPIDWRYDLDPATNPRLLERLGVNAVYNAGAIEWEGRIVLMVRLEDLPRKSIFAIAESETGVDGFRFWDEPILMPQTEDPETNIYDPRLTRHEDGWIYCVFCAERRDPNAAPEDPSAALASAGIARSKDLVTWERLPDMRTPSPQQRNAVLHPEFVEGKYAFYTRPMEGFIDTGKGGGIGWGLCDSIEKAAIEAEIIIDRKEYHTIKEFKNGLGPPPIRTDRGWLQLAHGVRESASGMRYVLYAFLTDLEEPWKVTARPGGYLLSPRGAERIGDTMNVLFCNGWIARENGEVFLYYASSDQRMHVTTTTVEILLDYVLNTPEDAGSSHAAARQRTDLIRRNHKKVSGTLLPT